MIKRILWETQNKRRIGQKNLCAGLLSQVRRDKYFHMLAKMQKSLEKQFDLARFVKMQRQQAYALLASLNSRQRYFVDYLATQLVYEST